eukprot:TRINITY_DN2583_c0_g2_i3.p1 TRINITY_DN2583_c0_g2~~TRINITY_DN2583_c0_g2_i3.p1  ORF type:complete len:290 (-),score=28.08 TRINITY_DN2583_c0_g2_i3:163-1032(-)
MALNPPASGKGIPRRVQGEVLVAQRGEMELELRITGRQTVVAKGTVLLSTIRVVFVPGKEGDFAGVELPLATIHTERLNQPISGPPFLSGKATLANAGEASFKLWLSSGGTSCFLKLFSLALFLARSGKPADRVLFAEEVRTGKIASRSVYVDISDPTKIYVDQPDESPTRSPKKIGGPRFSPHQILKGSSPFERKTAGMTHLDGDNRGRSRGYDSILPKDVSVHVPQQVLFQLALSPARQPSMVGLIPMQHYGSPARPLRGPYPPPGHVGGQKMMGPGFVFQAGGSFN